MSALSVQKTKLDGLVVVQPTVHGDARGFFLETYHRDKYAEAGIDVTFVQDNLSRSSKDILRGLHYQIERPQGKLVSVVQGAIFDVAVDLRKGSPTFGQWDGVVLSDENRYQLYVPVGFAHGFCVISDTAEVTYKCTDLYHPAGERSLRWDDPDIGIPWPVTGDDGPVLSDKDREAPLLSQIPEADLFSYPVAGT